MSRTEWKIEKIKPEDIARHLEQYHQVSFWNRNSLNDDDFLAEHFDKEIRDKRLLREEGRTYVKKIDSKLRKALKICEEKGISVARVYDAEYKGEINGPWEWRICSPTIEQVEELKVNRWEPIIGGFVTKIQKQSKMPKGKRKEISFKRIVDDVAILLKTKEKKE